MANPSPHTGYEPNAQANEVRAHVSQSGLEGEVFPILDLTRDDHSLPCAISTNSSTETCSKPKLGATLGHMCHRIEMGTLKDHPQLLDLMKK